jgi:outer membrane immunogenic protein
MKRSFVAAAALTWVLADSATAADMPTKAYRSSAEVFSWNGLYIGGHLGYGWSSNDWRIAGGSFSPTPFDIGSGSTNGALGGAQVGVNWQSGPMVFGLEADFSWADMSGQTCNDVLAGGVSLICSSKVNRFGTITGRMGGAFDRVLLYLKAGAAWARDTNTVTIGAFESSTSKSKWGWTAGAGVEYAITRNWAAKLEYDFLLFNAERYAFDVHFPTNGIPPFDADIKQRIHTVKLGFNYRFDWSSPLAAR